MTCAPRIMLALDYLLMNGGLPSIKTPFAIEIDVLAAIDKNCTDFQTPLGTYKPARDGLYCVFEDGIKTNGYFNGKQVPFYAAPFEKDGLFLAFTDDRTEEVKGVNGYALLIPGGLYLIAKFPDPLYNDPDNLVFCASYHELPHVDSISSELIVPILTAANNNFETFLSHLLDQDGRTIDDVNSDHAFDSIARASLLGYFLFDAAASRFERE